MCLWLSKYEASKVDEILGQWILHLIKMGLNVRTQFHIFV